MYLSPSMMCADYNELGREVRALDKAGADCFHIDVMDGVFVPNFGMGPQDIACVRNNTRKPIAVHLMVNDPQPHLKMFAELGADIIYIHAESKPFVLRGLQAIHAYGAKAGLAIGPEHSIKDIAALLPETDYNY